MNHGPRLVSAILLLAISISGAPAHGQSTQPVPTPYSLPDQPAAASDAVLDAAIAMDPYATVPLRTDIKNGVRTRFGTQFHASCFAALGKDAVPPEQRKELADRVIGAAVASMMDRCATRFSELAPYVAEWIGQMRRTVVVCGVQRTSSKLPKGGNVGGTNSTSHRGVSLELATLRDIVFPSVKYTPSPRGGLPLTASVDIEQDKRNSHLDLNHTPLIGMPVAFFKDAKAELDGGLFPMLESSYPVGSLIHEGFHSTGANNRSVQAHNTVTREPGNLCDPGDEFYDRVYILQKLCARPSVYPVEQTMASIVKGCGGGDANPCIKMFTRERPLKPSHGLTTASAKSLCAKIVAEGERIAGPSLARPPVYLDESQTKATSQPAH